MIYPLLCIYSHTSIENHTLVLGSYLPILSTYTLYSFARDIYSLIAYFVVTWHMAHPITNTTNF